MMWILCNMFVYNGIWCWRMHRYLWIDTFINDRYTASRNVNKTQNAAISELSNHLQRHLVVFIEVDWFRCTATHKICNRHSVIFFVHSSLTTLSFRIPLLLLFVSMRSHRHSLDPIFSSTRRASFILLFIKHILPLTNSIRFFCLCFW